MLNIYGSEDYPAVLRQADTLQAVLADINPQSAQVRIEGADHYFDNYNEELVAAITGWLATLEK